MNKQPTTSKSSALARFFKAIFSAGLLAASVMLLSGHTSQAGSATWALNPTSGDWNTASNWTPQTIPDGVSDIATFAFSNLASLSISGAAVEVSGIVFTPGASPYEITVNPTSAIFDLVVSGGGITNNSGILQNFATVPTGNGNPASIIFTNGATAGSLTAFTNRGATASKFEGGVITFFDNSTAGSATFTNNGGTARFMDGGHVEFWEMASADSGLFFNDGGTVNQAIGGQIEFITSATAGNARIINNAGAVDGAVGSRTLFFHNSTAANATLIANGGPSEGGGATILFFGDSNGGSAQIKVFGNGNMDISEHNDPGLTVGSIEGDGRIFLAFHNLTVGSNNRSTVFGGRISDRGGFLNAPGGSLTKIGTGKLVLRRRNTYTGGTTVKEGELIVNNIGGSGTGSGAVQVKGGKLGGKGEIAGAVTVGTGPGGGAVLAPGYLHGIGSPGALTIHSSLTFNSDATYEVGMNSSSVIADEVVALGVTINGAAEFAFVDIGSGILPAGTIFTVINNTSATPIAGTFSNLPDGAIFTSNGNSFKANYQGGDGNDLTLNVLP